MKLKSIIALAITSLVIIAYFTLNKSEKEIKKSTPKLAMNFVKCTAPAFLLDDVDTTKQISPLFNNLGNLHFPITTTNDRAQAFFDQGLKLSYAFNHAEAHRSFMEAARLDPNSAMAYWGQAFALGPNINDPLPLDERKIKINEALAKTQTTSDMDEIKGLYSVVDQKVQEDVPMFSAYIVSAQAAVNKRLSNATPSVYGFFNNVEQWEITK